MILLLSTHLFFAIYSLHGSSIGATDVVGTPGWLVVVVVLLSVMVVVTGMTSHLYRGQHRSFNVGANLSFSNVVRVWCAAHVGL